MVVERLRWSWRSGLSVAIFIGLCALLASSFETDPLKIFLEAVPSILGFGFLAGMVGGEIELHTAPNQGIRRSARNMLWGLVAGIVAGLFVAMVERDPSQGLQAGAIVGLLCALRGGLLPCIQHSILRVMLLTSGATPRRYVHFLDFAADRIFLRKVGGSYIFVHRLLMDYFAGKGGRAPRE
jgi:hypothetical protein